MHYRLTRKVEINRRKHRAERVTKASEPIEEMDCSFGCSKEITVWDRPMVTVWVAGKPIQATLDTGCS